MKTTLHIENLNETKTVELENELTIGRTPEAQLVLEDEGLSRVNTTVFVEDDEVLVTDEGSTNGTFLNGERITGSPKILRDGDTLKLGSHTTIRVEISDGRAVESVIDEPNRSVSAAVTETPVAPIAQPTTPSGAEKPPYILLAAVAITVLILAAAGIAFLIVSNTGGPSDSTGARTPTPTASRIPVRVIDPLGGEDVDSLEDLIASWETAEDEIKAENVADVTVESGDADEAELAVTSVFLQDRQRLALEGRPPVNIRPPGLDVPVELMGDGVVKQKRKLAEMKGRGYQQPLDFADLAEKRMSGELIEMPMAAQSYYLDVGGSASDGPFRSFSFREPAADILVGSPKYGILSRLASNFAGQKYDLNNSAHRKQMRMRLLRMFNKRARRILKELADTYFQRFGRPLRVTSLTRSMDYQKDLAARNANAFKNTGEGALPPHTSGCAFDLARKHMPVDEQNFLMRKLADMEKQGRLDGLIEYGANACFHVFIYDDASPPKM